MLVSVTGSQTRCARAALLALLLALLLAAGAAGWVEDKWGDRGEWSWKSPNVVLRCYASDVVTAEVLEEADIPPFNIPVNQTRGVQNLTTQTASLLIAFCPWPRGSLADALAALQYPVHELQELTLEELRKTPIRADSFKDLHLRKLTLLFSIRYPDDIDNDGVCLEPVIFESLPELAELKIDGLPYGKYGAILSPIHAASRLKAVHLNGGQSVGAWGGCAELRELTLENWEVPAAGGDGDEGWLAHCPQLSMLRLSSLAAVSLQRVLRGARAVTSLEMRGNEELSSAQLDAMLSLPRLQQLTIEFSVFNLISEETLTTAPIEKLTLSTPETLEAPDKKRSLWRRLARLPALCELGFTYSGDRPNFCDLLPTNGSLPALRRLSLANLPIGACLAAWDSLEYLDLRDNQIHRLELLSLPSVRAQALLVDTRVSATQESLGPLNETGYKLLQARFNESQKGNVTIRGDLTVNCDCGSGWLRRALLSLPLSLPGLRCADGASFLRAPAERLECEERECAICACRRAWRDNATVATCGGRARAAPRVPGLRALHAADNYIETLHADDLPETLLILDLTHNHISRLEAAAVAALFNVSARVMWLASNPLACDCTNRPLLAALQRHRDQVQDYERVTCANRRVLHALDVDELCSPPANASNLPILVTPPSSLTPSTLQFIPTLHPFDFTKPTELTKPFGNKDPTDPTTNPTDDPTDAAVPTKPIGATDSSIPDDCTICTGHNNLATIPTDLTDTTDGTVSVDVTFPDLTNPESFPTSQISPNPRTSLTPSSPPTPTPSQSPPTSLTPLILSVVVFVIACYC